MGGANQYRHSSSKRYICGQVPKPVQIPSFVCSGTMVIELREFNNKKKKKKNTMDTMQILSFVITWAKRGNLMKYLVLLTCSVL